MTVPFWLTPRTANPTPQADSTRVCICAESTTSVRSPAVPPPSKPVPAVTAVTSPVPVATGRAAPPVPAPAVNVKGPVLPALSRQVPLAEGSVIAALTWTGAAPGAVTMLKPKPSDPSGLVVARPTSVATTVAPHCSSVPSRR